MVENTRPAGQDAIEKQARAAAESSTLGPGTAGYTQSGAAYRGHEVAANHGLPHPAEPGTPNRIREGKLIDDGPA